MIKPDKYCDQLRNHVINTEKQPDVARISLDAIDCFWKIENSRILSDDNLLKIVFAAKSPKLGPYYIGTELLLTLQQEYSVIENIWRNLMESTAAHERWVAISVVRDERIPFNLALELVRNGIHDKSQKVRSFAIECIYIRNLTPVLSELKKVAGAEKNKKVLQTIELVMSHME